MPPFDDPAVEREFIDRLIKSPGWPKIVDEVQRAALRQLGSGLLQPVTISNETAANVAAYLGTFDFNEVTTAMDNADWPVPAFIDPEFVATVDEVLNRVLERRLRDANWWLPDHIDPARPTWIRGLHEALPAGEHRQSIDAIDHALQHGRALLLHRHRRVPDSPGRLVATRRRVPRGPNFRRLTSLCQPAGLLVRA